MKKSRFIAVFLAMIAIVCSFAGCSDKQKYNVKMYNISSESIDEEFARENRISGSSFDYANESSEVHNSDELPPFRTFVIKDKQTYDCVFKDQPIVVNFDKEVIVYILLPIVIATGIIPLIKLWLIMRISS